MWPLLIPLGILIWALVSDDEVKVELNDKLENNCSENFLNFSTSLDLPDSRKKQLRLTRKIIEDKIRAFFQEKNATSFLGYYIQGSSKHKTLIRKQNDTCDVDLGIYFSQKPTIKPTTLQKNVADLLTDQTLEGTEIKNKCVRVFYANKSHIDLPIYYKDKESNKYFIATGADNTWVEDDPKLFTEWFREQTADKQKVRLIKYFKAWTDRYKSVNAKKMPSGLALTVWVLVHFDGDARDDLAFIKTAHKLYLALAKQSLNDWECKMPTAPYDNVIRKLNEENRKTFLSALKELLEEVNQLFKLRSKEEAVKKWQGIFGKFFV
jgi:hypothetical protein